MRFSGGAQGVAAHHGPPMDVALGLRRATASRRWVGVLPCQIHRGGAIFACGAQDKSGDSVRRVGLKFRWGCGQLLVAWCGVVWRGVAWRGMAWVRAGCWQCWHAVHVWCVGTVLWQSPPLAAHPWVLWTKTCMLGLPYVVLKPGLIFLGADPTISCDSVLPAGECIPRGSKG